MDKHNIKCYTEVDVDTPLDGALTTGSVASRGQLPDRFDDNISQNPENASDTDGNGRERTSRTVMLYSLLKVPGAKS